MDLELNDQQQWIGEAVETLLARDGGWPDLVEFGATSVGGEDGLGAVELCLIARALGARLSPVPFLGSAAARFAGASGLGEHAVALAVLEPGGSWGAPPERTWLSGDGSVTGRKVAVEQAGTAERIAVVATAPDGAALAVVDADAPGVTRLLQPGFDASAAMFAVELAGVPVLAAPLGDDAVRRLLTIGALLAAADAVGAAGRLLEDACEYAAQRRQFGRTVGSFQALRHLLADLYVRQASSWSSVLYAAAALDEDVGDAARTVSIAKAYVSRATREVAHGAIQVFGGIAVTAEHPAHRFLRRIVVRGRQFGDADHHERALGRALASTAVAEPVS
jgi:alkylation response protein AidB-like acyl-CoA dehydrogenase